MPQPQLLIDSSLPFLEGLVEPLACVRRLPSSAFTAESVREADALLIRSVVQAEGDLLEGSSVRVIATATAGFDHIDAAYCDSHGIRWSNAPGCNAGGVVQYVLSALAHWSLARQRSLQGLTLGIVGVGQVGGRLQQRAEALGLRLLCCDPPRQEQEELPDFVPFETILAEADIISLHVPLTKEGRYPTYHLINKESLALCRRRPLLINACRGPVADTESLLGALEQGLLSDLIIDCWEGEPHIPHELARAAFLGTPHIAGWSSDGKWRGSRMALAYVCRELSLPEPEGLWDSTVLPSPAEPDIYLGNYPPSERILRALLHTCSLASTSEALRREPEAFASLRKSYIFPREASAFCIHGASPEEAPRLRLLGFQLEEV